jgi:S-ribosylhomocysteine lyase LuxS involved in autoinducer biosynthesis
MALKGLKKSEQSSNQDQIDNFIQGASKRIKKIEPSQQNYKRYTFSLTEEVNQQIDQLLVNCRVAKANRSIILKAAIHQLEKLTAEELQQAVLEQVK